MSFIDQITQDRLSKLHPAVRDEAATIIHDLWSKGIRVRVTQGLRTWAEQDDLYAQGRTKEGKIVTNARGGFSNHNYGLALDFCLLTDKGATWSMTIDTNSDAISDWQQVVKAFTDAGWSWGGAWRTFKDYPHVEKTFGKSVRELRELSQGGKIQYPTL